ncbi:UDP-glucuronosyltransferase 2C1-like isoform X2 [Anopheles albimanus]|uniref:UDP-glucuronosyltransferase 2C1-like isoform X2 n=1 Tax=Anopheles albimanus TaxID=7167 RepID=UPI00163F0E4C|nr:UDP-glucuronosyltransferase 2C1-like isoform X2 [Anopheles albimanus]
MASRVSSVSNRIRGTRWPDRGVSVKQAITTRVGEMEYLWSSVLTVIARLALFGMIDVCLSHSSNILYISAVASPSHFLWSEQLAKALAAKGHNVTLLNIYKQGSSGKNMHFLKLDGVEEGLLAEGPVDYLELHQLSPFQLLSSFADLEFSVCERALVSTALQRLRQYPISFTFQLIIHDQLAGPCLLLLLETFRHPPLVMASAASSYTSSALVFGSPVFTGFVPSQLHDMPLQMGLVDRGYNFLLTHLEVMSRQYFYNPLIDRLVQRHCENITSVSQYESSAIRAVVNSMSLLDPPEPRISQIVAVGGLHITPTRPIDVSYLGRDKGKYTKLVLVSFGSNVLISTLGDGTIQALAAVARKMPFVQFLWKTDTNKSPLGMVLPSNVLTAAWFPQNDLLGGGIVDVFVTHGGLLSVQEAIWHGVPMLGVPVYGDQYQNVRRLERLGIGRRLLLEALSAGSLQDHLHALINDESGRALCRFSHSRYTERARKISRMVRDAHPAPRAKAVWTIEWVMRNYQTSSELLLGVDLNGVGFIEKYTLDVLAFVLLAISCCTVALYHLSTACYRYLIYRFAMKKKME